MGENSWERKASRASGFGYGRDFSSSDPESEPSNYRVSAYRRISSFVMFYIEATHATLEIATDL